MTLPAASQLLVDHVQGLTTLDGRFQNPRLVNYDSVSGQKRGCFSLVFRADDLLTGKPVALKFFDPEGLGDVYRLTSFRRELEVLNLLRGCENCLQPESGMNSLVLQVQTVNGAVLAIKCEYFAVQWIPDQIDGYFLCQEAYSPVEKLKLLVAVVTSVQALHAREVFHRDLKPDNLRAEIRNGRRIVIPIDMGTAARLMSAPIQEAYHRSVGAPAYAAPEAHCGLAGNRHLAKWTDVHAIGCMLFELFNRDYYIRAYLSINKSASLHLGMMRAQIDFALDERSQKAQWDLTLNKMSNAFSPVPIDGPGSDVPKGISPILNEVLAGLTNVDYRVRPPLKWVRDRLYSAIAVLSNERRYLDRLARLREMRRLKRERLLEKERRFAAARFLKGG